uniref:PDZ and LIM domain protein Zasp n=1 Tax=Cacopsylla melanoneura TaxID=428564 RepID=A0A8D9BA69_9HEMI
MGKPKREERSSPPAPRREDQGIFDYAAKMRPYYTRTSPVPHAEGFPPSNECPHGPKSLLPPASLVRSISPVVTLSFPPVFPVLPAKPRSRCTSPDHVSRESTHPVETTYPTPSAYTTSQPPPPGPKEYISEPVAIPSITVAAEHVTDLPRYYDTPGLLAQAMTTAPITPFNPVPFPEPIEIPSMKPLPPESKPVLFRPESPMMNALTVAPERCYSPLPSITKPLDSLTALSDVNKPINLLLGEKEPEIPREPCRSMLSALTIASSRPYSPIPAPPPPAPTPVVHVITDAPFETYVPKLAGGQQPTKKTDTPKKPDAGREVDPSHPHSFPYTSSGLHIPATIPYYQEHIDEEDIHTKLRNSPLLIKSAAQESLSIQSKIMNILSQQESVAAKTTAISAEPLKSSALDFLQPKEDSKIIPTLGYKPNPLMDSNKSSSQTRDEGTQIVHDETRESVESKTCRTVTQTSSLEQYESKQEKVCQKICQTECQKICQAECPKICQVECQKSKTCTAEAPPKEESKPVYEPKVKFERQTSFDPKPKLASPPAAGAPTSTAPSVSSLLSMKLSSLIPSMPDPNPSSLPSNTGSGAGGKGATSGQTTAPRRGRGVLNPHPAPGARVPLCGQCYQQIRGPFITALGKIWCPDHFVCVRSQCKRPLQDIGFVEEDSGLYCEYCFEQFLAPNCHKCSQKIKGDCLNAIGRHYHPECFTCAYCGKLFGNNPFFLEEGLPYCENDWNDLFTTKCFACGFPIEAGDRWVEALSNNYHSLCFNCSVPSCKKNLEGQSFFAKAGRPFCKAHAR